MIQLTGNASWLFAMESRQRMPLKFGEIFILLTKRKLIQLPEKLSAFPILTKLAFPHMVDGVKR